MMQIGTLITYITFACVLISIITDYAKPYLGKVPVELFVLGTTQCIDFIALAVYLAYTGTVFTWIMIPVVFFGGFVVAYVCSKGWDALTDLIAKYTKDKNE